MFWNYAKLLKLGSVSRKGGDISHFFDDVKVTSLGLVNSVFSLNYEYEFYV